VDVEQQFKYAVKRKIWQEIREGRKSGKGFRPSFFLPNSFKISEYDFLFSLLK